MDVVAVGRFYDRFAGLYDLVFNQVFQPGRVESIGAMDFRQGDRVLEVGVGTGLNLPLYPAGVRVVGIDLSSPMLKEARRRRRVADGGARIHLGQMDATRMAFPDDAFDFVYAPYVISVVPHPREVVAEMGRVCRPGGKVVIVNHFGSRHRLGHWLESKLTPVTQHMGFRLDLPVESVLGLDGLEKIDDRRVNLLKLWRLLIFEKQPTRC
ncbi:MAG TPA: methyltransferase domain-containing protein [Acidobacteria bacterium]|nr:methyltransferase domain-containing protein [Acidobacteriota bacterium]